MNQNAELLNFVYQNSQMGVATISQLLGIVEDAAMKKQLQSQSDEYERIHDKAAKLLNKNGYDEKGIGALDKIKAYLMINLQTMADKTNSHIAQMMILGSAMGIIQATRNINKYRHDAEWDILDLMKDLLRFEEDNFQALKAYL